MGNQKRVTFFLAPEDDVKLREIAAQEGLTASAWLRQRVKRLLAESPEALRPLEESST